ncbi:MAG: hypothetical protein AAF483_03165 [Planctomycetota bacterium]
MLRSAETQKAAADDVTSADWPTAKLRAGLTTSADLPLLSRAMTMHPTSLNISLSRGGRNAKH